MSLVVDRCPFYEHETEIGIPSGPVVVRSYQIAVWVGLSLRDSLSPPFPAVLDTGHSHNFSIKEELLESWMGAPADDLLTIGHARVNKQLVELKDATIVVYPNILGKRDVASGTPPFVLRLPEGIAVHRRNDPIAPRLPLLCMRALVRNHLRLVIDGQQMEVSTERQ
jgi:hypothetical protein